MQLIRGLYNLRDEHKGGVLTIGNFDGLHLGHQALLAKTRELAGAAGTHSCLMSFQPLPQEYFAIRNGQPQQVKSRLLNQREKLRTLRRLPAAIQPHHYLLLRFTGALAGMSAEQFIDQVLVHKLAVHTVVIGDDFRFGADRLGDRRLLTEKGRQRGFQVLALDSHRVDRHRVSSTLVRQALAEGRFDQAEKMLGRPYSMCGHVGHGEKRGRQIGFPTANILIDRPQSPLTGVYSVTMQTRRYGAVRGIANLGKRPTLDGERMQLEVHLFDFAADLYGQYACVRFHHKIRDEKKFESFDALKQQIQLDCDVARRHHADLA